MEEVSYETLVLQTLTCEFLRKSRTKRSFWRLDSQPSAEIARVECAKCKRECDLSHARATLCGDRACRVREMQARVQPSAEIVRVECAKCRRECDLSGARSVELEAEDWRPCSTTVVRGVSGELEWGAGRESHKSVPQQCPTRVS